MNVVISNQEMQIPKRKRGRLCCINFRRLMLKRYNNKFRCIKIIIINKLSGCKKLHLAKKIVFFVIKWFHEMKTSYLKSHMRNYNALVDKLISCILVDISCNNFDELRNVILLKCTFA